MRRKKKRQLRLYSSRNQLRKIMHVSTQKMKEKRKLLATISWIKCKCYSFFFLLLVPSTEAHDVTSDANGEYRAFQLRTLNKLHSQPIHTQKKKRERKKLSLKKPSSSSLLFCIFTKSIQFDHILSRKSTDAQNETNHFTIFELVNANLLRW